MLSSIRKRVHVAMTLALGLVLAAAMPAHAWIYSGYSGNASHYESGVYRGWGNVDLFRHSDSGVWGNVVFEEGYTYKQNNGLTDMQNSCIETWVDQTGIDEHRAPDVFVNCRAGGRYFPLVAVQRHWAGGVYDDPFSPGIEYLRFGNSTTQVNDNPGVMVCQLRVDGAKAWDRINPGGAGSNCTGSGLSVSPFHDRVGYAGAWGTTLENMNTADEPQHVRIDGLGVLYTGETMVGGDLLLTYDGGHSARMQQDGNFVVVRHSDGAVLWAASNCGLTPVAGSTITMQSDGNLVIYGPAGNPGAKWASANINSCGGGSFGGSTPYLEIPLNSNLRVMNSGSPLWDIY